MTTLVSELDHMAYAKTIRLRGYTRRTGITVLQALSAGDAATVLIRANPDWTKADHLHLAAAHHDEATRQKAAWSRIVNEASLATFGRPYGIWDYKVSGIAREEFSAEHKEALRFAAHAGGNHATLALAHERAAKRRGVRPC